MKRRQDSSGVAAESGEVLADREAAKGSAYGATCQRVLAMALFLALVMLYAFEHFSKEQMRMDYELKLQQVATSVQTNTKADHAHLESASGKACPKCPDCASLKHREVALKNAVNPNSLVAKKAIYEVKNQRLQIFLQDTARDVLRLRFGAEPYRIELLLQLPPESGSSEAAVVTLEMAPAALMPVAVLYFMDQVDRGAWNGCSFIRNAVHVLQASNRGKLCNPELFKNSRGEEQSIVFQEYSPAFPHEKFTVGLAGRPGGPDFYINLQDNKRGHGPGGQGSCKMNAHFYVSIALFPHIAPM